MRAYDAWRACLRMLGLTRNPEPAPASADPAAPPRRTYRDVLLTPSAEVKRDSFSDNYVLVSV
jgi:hypothetical protein